MAEKPQLDLKNMVMSLFVLAVLLTAGTAAVTAEGGAERLKLWYDQPAEKWTSALPIGNGGFGAMIFGHIKKERVQFNHDTLWKGEPHDYTHRGAVKVLPELRRLLFEGKQNEAQQLANAEFMSISTTGSNRQEAYQPFGDLYLEFPGHEDSTNYYRELDIENAIAAVRYKADGVTYTREYFASYPDQAIVIRLTADQPGKLNFIGSLASPHEGATVCAANDALVLSGQVEAGKTRFQAIANVRVENGSVKASGNTLQIENADRATLVLIGATSFVNFRDISGDPAEQCKQLLAAANARSYAQLRGAHVADYRALFDRCTLDLGTSHHVNKPTDQRLEAFGTDDPQLATLFFQYGRYLLIACSRPGAQPANLQGLWNESKSPPWEGKYTTNINVEMNYWPAELTGLSECHDPLFAALQDLAISGAIVAKEHYGARGWVVHHNFDLWRGAAPINNANHGIWPTGSAWLCQHLWWRYEFTGDQAFLKNDAYPLLKQASLFYLDYLTEDPRGSGCLISGPSNSPEHGGLVMGPTMDHQIVRTLLRNTAAAAEQLGVDSDLQKQWLDTAARIAPNQVGSGGQLKEWFYKEDYKTTHRHVSHLWGLHPGMEIHPRKTPKLAEACRVTLKYRGDGGMGWSKTWKVNFWARLFDGDYAYKMLAETLRGNTYPNLFDKGPPYQIDGNFGATSGVAEMLLQSDGHEIDLLPALPSVWATGKVTGLQARGGFVLDIEWKDGKLATATIQSLLGRPVKVRYGDTLIDLQAGKGKTVTLNNKLQG